MSTSGALIAAMLGLPLAMLTLCLSRRLRRYIPALLAIAPLPGLVAALQGFDGATLVLPPTLLGLTFTLDRAGAMLLGASALLWAAAGAYSFDYLRDKSDRGRFAVWWLMTLTGSLGIFVAADLVSFYLFFTLVSLAAYGLVAFDDSPAAVRAGAVYIALAILAEAFLLMGFVLLGAASPNGSLLMSDAATALATSPWRNAALVFLMLGFGLKIGLVPLHVWMPLAYSAAPIPAAAVLSGAAVKAGVIFIRFVPFAPAQPDWGRALAAAGFFSAFYGVAIGITQSNPKTVLAYSSVSQMGLLAAVIGIGMVDGNPGVATPIIFYAVHHTLVKGGLFLAAGAGAPTKARVFWLVLLPAAVLALGLGGLPLSGGALAKLAIKGPLGNGVAPTLASLSAVASTVLMLHFLQRLKVSLSRTADTRGVIFPWLVIAVAAVVVPWVLYLRIFGSVYDVFSPKELWAAFWPSLVGAMLAVGLWYWQKMLPQIPAGDVLALADNVKRPARGLSEAMERVDDRLKEWPVAGVLFLLVAVVLIATMFVGR